MNRHRNCVSAPAVPYPTIHRGIFQHPRRRVRSRRGRSARLVAASVILGFVFGRSVSFSAEGEPATEQFQAFAAKEKTRLSQVKSYAMKGEIKVTVERLFQAANGGPREMKRTFSVWGKGGEIKEIVESLDEAGKPSGTATSYLDAKRVTLIHAGGSNPRRMAKIFTLGPLAGLFNECPAFMEYSFLWVSIPPGGIPALLPSELASDEKWTAVGKSLQSAVMGEDGLLHATVAGTKGSASIDLVKTPDSDGGYQIKAASFFTNDGYLDRKIEVLDYFRDEKVGLIGKTFRVGVYQSSPSPILLATWELEIKELKVNVPVDDELFTFDPSSVDMIYDGDTKRAIPVPK